MHATPIVLVYKVHGCIIILFEFGRVVILSYSFCIDDQVVWGLRRLVARQHLIPNLFALEILRSNQCAERSMQEVQALYSICK